MRKTVIKQNVWRRWQYVTKNEIIYFSADHKLNCYCDLSGLESYPEKRKSPECLDEGGHDVSVSCSRAYVCAAFFYPVLLMIVPYYFIGFFKSKLIYV